MSFAAGAFSSGLSRGGGGGGGGGGGDGQRRLFGKSHNKDKDGGDWDRFGKDSGKETGKDSGKDTKDGSGSEPRTGIAHLMFHALSSVPSNQGQMGEDEQEDRKSTG